MSKRPNALIVDGDPYAFQAALRHEHASVDDEGFALAFQPVNQAVADAAGRIQELADKLDADVVLTLSCKSGRYFRHDLGSYKEARKMSVRPLGVKDVKAGLAERFPTVILPNLEGDDVIGILMTDRKFKPKQRKINVSIDKDMKTITGWFINPDKMTEPVFITPEEADRWFYAQAIAGDITDGFSGAPSFGMATALKLLEDGMKLELYPHAMERGPRKGQIEMRRREVPAANHWETVLSCYEVTDLTPDVALFNARLARILTADLWDHKNKVPILWNPPQ